MSEISVAVNRLTETNNLLRLDMKRLAAMDAMIQDILSATTALQSTDRNQRTSQDPMQALSLAVSNLGVHAQTIAHEQHLLSSLHFSMIRARHEKIEKAHANTYEWIFRDSVPDNATPIRFAQWLEAGTGIYWIHGKPGCGKSTLMKFICDHAQTRNHLGRWSQSHAKSLQERTRNITDEEKLSYEAELIESYYQQQGDGTQSRKGEIARMVTAKYFFWNAGSKLQKSQEGLLRSLVFEVLRQCPELIRHVRKARSRYRGFADDLGETGSLVEEAPWSFEELISTLQDVINVRISATFCLFIDGLDEYKEENKRTYRDLVATLNRIAQFPNVKICASSRPWTVFLDAFKGRSMYSIKLEELTRGDIRRFVSDTFQEHDQYRRLKDHDPAYNTLIGEVARRAQGVFLWVYLVVKDLLEGLTYNDSVQTMLARLDQFPEDLEDFFQHMIESIPRQYRHQAARTFLVTMAAPAPLLLVLHSFLDDIEANPEYLSCRSQMPLDISELTFRHDRMRRQLEGRTKGLLEVVSNSQATEPYYQFRVDFLHRTVKDFLHSSSKVQSFMLNGQKDAFKTWVLVCRGILAEVRHAPFKTNYNMKLEKRRNMQNELVFVSPEHLNRLYGFFFEFVYFAEKALHGSDNESAMLALFKTFERASENAKARLNDDSDRLPEIICELGVLELLQNMDYDWSKLSSPNPTPRSLIRRALLSFQGAPQQQVGVVEYLLGRGVDPNQVRMENSHFQEYMAMLVNNKSTEEQEEDSFRVVAALVAHGADLSARLSTSHLGKLTAQDAIHKLFPPSLASGILPAGNPPTEQALQLHLATRVPIRPVRPMVVQEVAGNTPYSGGKATLWSRLSRVFGRENS